MYAHLQVHYATVIYLVLSFPLRISMNFVSFSVFSSWKGGGGGGVKEGETHGLVSVRA